MLSPIQKSLLLLAPAGFILVFTFIAPIALTLPISFREYEPGVGITDRWTFEYYVKIATDAYILEILGRTLLLGFFVTATSLVLGYPVALYLARTRSFARNIVIGLIIFPLLINVVVRSFGWVTLLANRGVINNALRSLGIVEMPVQLLFNMIGLCISMTHIMLPFMVLLLLAAIQNIPDEVENAAAVLGANWFTVLTKVTLPLSLPGIIAGSILVFVLTISSLVTPRLVGGPTYKVMSTLIMDEYLRLLNWPFGSALATVMTLIVIMMIWLLMVSTRKVAP